MKRFQLNNLTPDQYKSLLCRPGEPAQVDDAVRRICLDVKTRGDEAVRDYAVQYDSALLDNFEVTDHELVKAEEALPERLRSAILESIASLHAFHKTQGQVEAAVETLNGVRCWRERRPVNSVGFYIPAGSAPLPSTVLMLGIPAKIAGCPNITLCSPARRDGSVDPTVLAAATMLGISNVYRIGGAQAIAAMAYGTESIPKVDKIFGPGNRYVTAAKRFVSADPDGVAIDMLAGPSELLIIADDHADPSIVATDLLSQAEHDPDSQVVLVTTSSKVAESVLVQLNDQMDGLPRREILLRSLASSFILEVATIDEAIEFSNDYAPEHLIINTRNPESLVSRIQNAGSVFLGAYAPVTAGDYASGTNHTLP
ncbi:MAG: histidinol dehydrogenase, partial [Ignavibacteriales bacterium]|nr:histidinol dehydrogenase [Ignavibacteriales bacterium]